MKPRAENLLQEALSLATQERAEIAGALLKSLEESESEAEAAWRQEVTVRIAALDAGEIETTPWQEIRDGLLARLRERRNRAL